MSKTGTDFEEIESTLGVKGEIEVALRLHELSHIFGEDILEHMLEHVKNTEHEGAKRKSKTEQVVHSEAKTLEDKLKEAADHLNQTADALIRNEMGIPEDVEEIIVELNIKGR
jgi:hypothetical protein